VNRTITLRDVADAADVHPSTASRALNDQTRELVNDRTVQRILAAAEALGYQPNALAQGLKGSRTMTIGMLIPDLTNPLFPPIARGVEDVCTDAGFTLLLANTDNDRAKERSVLEVMARRRVDGLVMATVHRDSPTWTEVLRADFPVVLVNRTADVPNLPSVSGDDHAGIGLAVRHLAELGHRRIAHLAGPTEVSTGLQRQQSYANWMQVLGLDVDPDLIVPCSWFTQQAGAAAFATLLDRATGATAVVAANDLVALGCYDVAAERGVRIPEDLSIVGYNDIPFTDRFAPPLTSVRIPHYQIGVKAAELMLDAIDSPGSVHVGLRLPPELRVRSSTAAPPAT
jgi:LacI family transcriptional regulator